MSAAAQATFELHPAVLEHVGLAAALAELASGSGARAGISVATDLEDSRNDPADALVFGVAREVMSNIVRHSQATYASVTLRLIDEACCLEVEDDGVGFTEHQAARRLADGHIGIASHRARVEAAGEHSRCSHCHRGRGSGSQCRFAARTTTMLGQTCKCACPSRATAEHQRKTSATGYDLGRVRLGPGSKPIDHRTVGRDQKFLEVPLNVTGLAIGVDGFSQFCIQRVLVVAVEVGLRQQRE